MASAQAEAKKKFGGLFGKKDDAEEEGADDAAEEETPEEGDEEAPDTGYDVKACANDIMAAVKAGDVDALAEALEELLEKVK